MAQQAGVWLGCQCRRAAALRFQPPAVAFAPAAPIRRSGFQAQLVLEQLAIGCGGLLQLKAPQPKGLQLEGREGTAAALQFHPVEAHQIGLPGAVGRQALVVVD